MICTEQVKGIIFDYGGTLDSNGMHWAEVIWMAYEAAGVPVNKASFRDAYVHGECTLGKNRIVLPHHTFGDMLRIKTDLQIEWLKENGLLDTANAIPEVKEQIASWCYTYAAGAIEKAKPLVKLLAKKYPLVLVSNFYGNIEAVLKDFKLEQYFQSIVESAVVGIRKPDPAIFRLGVEQIQLPAETIVVIGDSHDKDIVPATTLGCQTIWLKSIGWSAYKGDETADAIIEDFGELKEIFDLQ